MIKKIIHIKTGEDITDRTTIGAKGDCIFIVHKDGSVDDDFLTDSGDYVEKKLSTFEMLKRMIYHDDACRNSVIKQSTPTDPVLAKLCELTGAKMYDDYLLLDIIEVTYREDTILENIGHHLITGDIVRILYTPWLSQNQNDTRTLEEYLESISETGVACQKDLKTYFVFKGIDTYYDYTRKPIYEGKHGKKRIIGNIFHEYSKHLRNEENKFEEIKKLLNL